MSPLLTSAQLFYRDFMEDLDHGHKAESTGEKLFYLRKTCINGFMAMDSAIALYWKDIVLPDWAGLMAYCEELLAKPDAMEKILRSLNGVLSRGQLIATLRFLENTGDPERFSPNLVDAGVVFCLLQDKNGQLPYADLAQKLCKMQKLRNAAFHSGRNFSEIEAAASVKEIREFCHISAKLNPIFRDALSLDNRGLLRAA